MKRYNIDQCCDFCSMSEDAEGDYVEFDEAESLHNRVKDNEIQITRMTETIRRLRAALNDIANENTGVEPALFAYACLNPE